MRKIWKPLVTAALVGAMVFSGIAWAQTDDGTPAEDRPAYGRIVDTLQALVDDGTITADQAEAVAAFLVENAPDRPMRPGARLRHGIAEAAGFLGLEPADVGAALRDGQTLAEIAADNGSSADALIAFLVGDVADHLQEKVDDGTITAAEMDERLAEATERITDFVNGEIPDRPVRGGPGGGGFDEAPPQGGPGAEA